MVSGGKKTVHRALTVVPPRSNGVETGSVSRAFWKGLPQCIWILDQSYLCLARDLGIDKALMSLEHHLRSFSDH